MQATSHKRTAWRHETIEIPKGGLTEHQRLRLYLNWRAVIAQRADKLIEQMAEQEKLDAVLAESAWVSPRVDIKDKILKLLDK
jgi:Skp family chaperone for outer membrane proteins